MRTKAEKLIEMGNRIAGFFRAYPPDEAAAGIRHHLVSFWTPGMVACLQQRLAADHTGAEALLVQAMKAPPDTSS